MSETAYLQHLGFQRARPQAPLARYVQWFWRLKFPSKSFAHRAEYMHANGASGLTLNLGDDQHLSSGTWRHGFNLDAAECRSRTLHLNGAIHCFGILLQPSAYYSFTGTTPNQSSAGITSLPLTMQRKLGTLERTLTGITAFSQQVAAAELWCLDQIENALSDPVTQAILKIQSQRGQLDLQALHQSLQVSARHLERLFQKHVGITPKQMIVLHKLAYARELIKTQTGRSLTAIAVEAGFYDQAHFSHAFTKSLGVNPKAYQTRVTLEATSIERSH